MSRTTMTRTRVPVVNASVREETLDDGNPLLTGVPLVPQLDEAMRLTELSEPADTTAWSREEVIAHHATHVFVTNATFGRALIATMCQVRSSYRSRDLRTQACRDYAISANLLLHHTAARERREMPSPFGIAPGAQPRGIMFVASVRMGRRSFAGIVQSQVGRGTRPVKVQTTTGLTEYLQLRSLRILWPIGGKLLSLGQAYFSAIDAELGTTYSARTHGPAFRESDVVPWMCALGVASNLGLLIVERINYHDAVAKAAESSWNALGQFTRATGIPVLCLATPGATAICLSTLSGAVHDLTAAGLIEISPCQNSLELHWIDICQTIYSHTLSFAVARPMPSWLPDAAYELALGYPGVLAKALAGVALQLSALKVTTLTADMFIRYGRRAVELDLPHLEALRMIRQGGVYCPSSLLRHADWLSFGELTAVHPAPELR